MNESFYSAFLCVSSNLYNPTCSGMLLTGLYKMGSLQKLASAGIPSTVKLFDWKNTSVGSGGRL